MPARCRTAEIAGGVAFKGWSICMVPVVGLQYRPAAVDALRRLRPIRTTPTECAFIHSLSAQVIGQVDAN